MRDWMVRRRKHAGLTQVELAEELAVTQGAISGWETGKAVTMSLPLLDRLARALGAPFGDMVQEELQYQNEHGKSA